MSETHKPARCVIGRDGSVFVQRIIPQADSGDTPAVAVPEAVYNRVRQWLAQDAQWCAAHDMPEPSRYASELLALLPEIPE